jgi:hypothetical protein
MLKESSSTAVHVSIVHNILLLLCILSLFFIFKDPMFPWTNLSYIKIIVNEGGAVNFMQEILKLIPSYYTQIKYLQKTIARKHMSLANIK